MHTERTCRKPRELGPFRPQARIFLSACMLINECVHTGSDSSAWASSRSVAWAAVKRFRAESICCTAHAQLKWKHTFDGQNSLWFHTKSAQNAQNLRVLSRTGVGYVRKENVRLKNIYRTWWTHLNFKPIIQFVQVIAIGLCVCVLRNIFTLQDIYKKYIYILFYCITCFHTDV